MLAVGSGSTHENSVGREGEVGVVVDRQHRVSGERGNLYIAAHLPLCQPQLDLHDHENYDDKHAEEDMQGRR